MNPDMQGGRSPFFTACENLHIEAAEILIKHGAELDVRKKTGSSFGTITYLRWATRSNLVPVVEMLMKHGKGSFSEEELDQCRDMAKISGLPEVERVLQNGFA